MATTVKDNALGSESINTPIDAFDVSVVGKEFSLDRLLLASARCLLAFIFVFSGLVKMVNWNEAMLYMTAKNFVVPNFFLFCAMLIEIVAGLMIAFGRQVRMSAAILFLYMLPVTLIFHNFWAFQGDESKTQLINFLKNLSIMGGLLTLFVLDRVRRGDYVPKHA